MSTGETSNDQCRAIADAAMDVIIDRCGSEEAARRQLMDLLGFADDEEPPNCEEVLAGGATPDVLESMSNQRRYALCRAWRLIQSEDNVPLREALNRAWMEIREAEGD